MLNMVICIKSKWLWKTVILSNNNVLPPNAQMLAWTHLIRKSCLARIQHVTLGHVSDLNDFLIHFITQVQCRNFLNGSQIY
jgi:hypothetical protein